DFLHGNLTKSKPLKDASAYLPANTHMTLFDEAELVFLANGVDLLGDAVFSGLGSDGATIDGAQKLQNFWAKVIPTHAEQCAWIDNYVSEVGWLHPEAVNVMLWRRLAVPGISDILGSVPGLHGYAYDWYLDTIQT